MARTQRLFLTVSDVTRRARQQGYDVAPDTIRAAERRGDLMAIRTLSGVRLFDEREADRFIARRVAALQAASERGSAA